MTKLLLRLFVRDHENTENAAVRTACGLLSSWVGIVCNALLCAAKLTIGIVSGSVSITADAVNNLSDAAASVVTLLGFKLASKPADDEHPYGHDRIEYLAGLAVAVLILIIGFELVKSSVDKILHPTAVEFSPALVIVLVLSILGKLWLAIFNRTLGKKIRSSALIAASADSRNDVLATSAVLLACVIGKATGLMLDGYIGLLVAVFILCSGIGIIKDTIDPLLGAAPDEELVHRIAGIVTAQEKVLGVHDLIIHDYGPGRRFASLHAEMDAQQDVLESHEIIDDLERLVKQELNVELVIHFDPVVTDDEERNTMRNQIEQIVREIDERLSIHDFRMVRGVGHTNVIFDMVVPFDLRAQTSFLKKTINEKLGAGGETYYAVITFDCEAFNDPHTR